MKARWENLREVNAALKRMPEHVRSNTQQVMDTTAFQIARKAEATVKRRTGLLAGSITWKSNPRWLNAIVAVDRVAFYWKFLEYGTVKMGASPFLRPAKASMESDHESRMTQALEKALTQAEREAAI